MAGYPANASMSALLLAMKEKALQDNTQLKYVRDVRVTLNVYWPPYTSPVLYLQPLGTIEEPAGEHEAGIEGIIARHIVRVECVIHSYSREECEAAILGSSSEIGLLGFVSDVLSFYENNWLGLKDATGLERGVAPICRTEENTYIQTSDADETIFFNIARLRYEAQTRPFIRPTDT